MELIFVAKVAEQSKMLATQKIEVQSIYSEIENLPKNDGSSIDFNSWPLDLLADYVEKTHHRYVEEKTPILQQFLDKLCKVHGGGHPELFEIRDLFFASAKDLGAHLKKKNSFFSLSSKIW
jgi:regulator of cell morphogenesis and NO signaling